MRRIKISLNEYEALMQAAADKLAQAQTEISELKQQRDDLLAACEALVDDVKGIVEHGSHSTAWDDCPVCQAKTAISKARGEK